jgi:hypothetical protein
MRHLFSLCFFVVICSAFVVQAQTPKPSAPSDADIVARIRGDGKGKLSVAVTENKSGEFEWNAKEQLWYFQRGYLVKRSANLPDFPNAVLEVGGLAVYRYVNGHWVHSRDLVTFNRYHGLPQPDNDTLLAIVKAAPERAFRTDWQRVEGGFKELSIPETPAFKWHSDKSFTFPVRVSYNLRWDNVHTVACTREWDVRVYRLPNGIWGNPSGMHSRSVTACRT